METIRDDKIAEFLDKLTALSREYGLGLTGSVTMFVMESDDYGRCYCYNSESEIEFA